MNAAIGIDVGGTKVSVALGTDKGKILVHKRFKTQKSTKTKECIRQLKETIDLLVKEAKSQKLKLVGIGVVIPGAVDPEKGIVPRSPHLVGWQGLPLKSILEKEYKLPVMMVNDAKGAAVAEKIFGAAKECQNFIYMTVSTGVGSGIYVNGRLLQGASFVAGEVGHTTIQTNGGEKWKMNEEGVLEAYASGTAIHQYVVSQIKKGKGSKKLKKLHRDKKLDTREIAHLAGEGDALSVRAFARAAEYLGVGVANLLNILNPEMIIFGGGVWKTAPALFMKAFKQSCQKKSWPEAYKVVKIVKTKLGDFGGNLGALAMVFESLKKKKK